MSDDYLFNTALDLDYPGLSKVKAAVEAGDFPAARAAWAAHVRNRTNPPKRTSTPSPYEPDDFGPRYRGVPRPNSGFMNGWIDYALKGIDQGHANQFSRESPYKANHLKQAVFEYERTGNPVYPKAWVANSGRWMTQYRLPPYSALKTTPGGWKFVPASRRSFKYLNAGQRILDGWWNAYIAFVNDPEFNDEAIVNFTKSVIEHGMYFRSDTTTSYGNWHVAGIHGMFTVTCLFPECRWSDQWRAWAINEFVKYIDTHNLPDGSNVEVCTHYGNLSLGHQQGFIHKAAVCGYDDQIPASYMARLKTLFDFTLYTMTPNRAGLELGGGKTCELRGVVPDRNPRGEWLANYYIIERGLELYPDDDFYKWIVSEGKKGKPPRDTTKLFPYFGLAVMRTGWQRDATLLSLKTGPAGILHGNFDAGSISMWAYGRRIIWDSPFATAYDNNPSSAHSTIMVDGKCQKNVNGGTGLPINMAWQSTTTQRPTSTPRIVADVESAGHPSSGSEFEHATSLFDAYWDTDPHRPVLHYRRVLFVKPDTFLVIDDLVNRDGASHVYDSRWILKSENVATSAATRARVTTDKDQPNLLILPLGTADVSVRRKEDDPFLKDIKTGLWQGVSVVTHRQTSGEDDSRFVTLLLPLRTGASDPVISVDCVDDDRWDVRFSDGRRLNVAVAAGHDGRITVEESGGASRKVDLVSGCVDRPFYCYFENFEVYDSGESPKMPYRQSFQGLTHQVRPPESLAGVEGKWVGRMMIKGTGRTSARAGANTRIPSATTALVAKAKVGVADALQRDIRFRMSLLLHAKERGGTTAGTIVHGDWLTLRSGSGGRFVEYGTSFPVPPETEKIRFVFLEVEPQEAGPDAAIYLDAIRILYPGETETEGQPTEVPNHL